MTLPSGIPIDELDPGIRPQDDLFRHVNGRWLARTEIPADRARDSAFRILAEEAENAVREIVEEAASAPEGSEERKFGDLYASFMDADRAEQLGSQPIDQALTAARAVSSIPGLLETLGRLERLGIGGLYRLFGDTDPGKPERYLVFFEQAAISLPDESYYREERFSGVRDAFVSHVQRMFELVGLPDADRAAHRVFALETAVAGHHWDSVASRDREKTYNLCTWTDVLSEGPDLRGWLAALDPPAGAFDEIVLRQPSFSTGLASLLTDQRVPAWRDWLCWQVIHSAAGYLSEAFVQEDLDFYGRTLSGTPSCVSDGSGVSRWSSRRWGKLSAGATSAGTSHRAPGSGWMSWWPTSSRPTARASRSSNGWGRNPPAGLGQAGEVHAEDRLPG